MNRPIYALHPGYVYSVNDGDRHYISAHRLSQLYRLPAGTWFEWRKEELVPGLTRAGFIHLYPQDNGNYDLTEENGNRKQRP